MRSANAVHVGRTVDRALLALYYAGRAVANRALHLAEVFDELGEIAAIAEREGHVVRVRSQAIAGNLKVAGRGIVELAQETHGVVIAAVPDMVGQHELGIAFYADPGPAIANLGILEIVDAVPFLAADKAPDFIALNIGGLNVHDGVGHESLALLANPQDQIADRVFIDPADTLCRADAHALDQQVENRGGFPVGNSKIAVGGFGLVDESLTASTAAATGLALGILAVFLGFLVLAGGDDHNSGFQASPKL